MKTLKADKSTSTIFINYLAKDPKRSWRIEQTFELIQRLQQEERFKHTTFLVNTLPELITSLDKSIKEEGLPNTFSYSAIENFYQLPAIVKALLGMDTFR